MRPAILLLVLGLAAAVHCDTPKNEVFCEAVKEASQKCVNSQGMQSDPDLDSVIEQANIPATGELTWDQLSSVLQGLVNGMNCDDLKPLNDECTAARKAVKNCK